MRTLCERARGMRDLEGGRNTYLGDAYRVEADLYRTRV